MREKNCGWRIDVFYANEGMMQDVISSDILNDVSARVDMWLTADYGLRPLSDLTDIERYNNGDLFHTFWSREYSKSK